MVKAYVFVEIFTPTYYEKCLMIKSDLFSRSNISKRVPLKSIYSDISGKSKFFSTGIISAFFGVFQVKARKMALNMMLFRFLPHS
jgi:hypothetical protein